MQDAIKDGSDALDGLVAFTKRFVSLSEVQAIAVALWIAHTHALDAADNTPYLNISSAEKQCGKTLLQEVLSLLVACRRVNVSKSICV